MPSGPRRPDTAVLILAALLTPTAIGGAAAIATGIALGQTSAATPEGTLCGTAWNPRDAGFTSDFLTQHGKELCAAALGERGPIGVILLVGGLLLLAGVIAILVAYLRHPPISDGDEHPGDNTDSAG